MKFHQIKTARLLQLGASWHTTITRLIGAPPSGYGIVHMAAESNGKESPVIRDRKRWPVGIMQVPRRIGQRWGRTTEELEDPTTNIYTWALQTNRDSNYIHETYASDWTVADADFWLAVRLYWILGQTVFDRLYGTARAVGTAYRKTAGLQSWVRTQMSPKQHFGRHTYKDLQGKIDHLDNFKAGLTTLEGANFKTKSFTEPPAVTPGNLLRAQMIGARV